jgi:hypothetical protein
VRSKLVRCCVSEFLFDVHRKQDVSTYAEETPEGKTQEGDSAQGMLI